MLKVREINNHSLHSSLSVIAYVQGQLTNNSTDFIYL